MLSPRHEESLELSPPWPATELRADCCQKRSGDPNPQYFLKSTAVQMGGVLPYKWEAYCRVSLSSKLKSQESTAIYKWVAYCRTNWRCTAVLFRQVVGVGVSETLPIL